MRRDDMKEQSKMELKLILFLAVMFTLLIVGIYGIVSDLREAEPGIIKHCYPGADWDEVDDPGYDTTNKNE